MGKKIEDVYETILDRMGWFGERAGQVVRGRAFRVAGLLLMIVGVLVFGVSILLKSFMKGAGGRVSGRYEV